MSSYISDFKTGKLITPLNKMDNGSYSYKLTARYGDVYTSDFKPYFTPQEMLTIGVFEGKYMNDCRDEFPIEWFKDAKISEKANVKYNYFKIKSRMSLQQWVSNGWIPIVPGDPDNRGWFQWYCRYFIGRRLHGVDDIQIKRWKSFKRHYGQVKKNCKKGDLTCRPKQRQALLQWAYNAFI